MKGAVDNEQEERGRLLGIGELTEVREAYDAAVLASPDIDRFCSSSAWVLPAHEAFHPSETIVASQSPDGFVVLSLGEAPGLGAFLAPLEAMWGLACPIVGPSPAPLARATVEVVSQVPGWRLLWLSGVLRDGPLFRALVQGFGQRVDARLGPVTQRFRASLDGGFDGWLSRRSGLFRKRIRAALRWAAEELTFEWVDGKTVFERAGAEDLFRRIHAVEQKSWKGLEGTGFVGGDMRRFYEVMVPDLARTRSGGHRLRVLFARKGDEDVGVCFGGVFGDTYRGLQNSFDDRFRDHSLGNVMQAETIRRLCAEGVGIYDLGSGMEYKARWAEDVFETVTLLVVRR